jgi:hypothetical protein
MNKRAIVFFIILLAIVMVVIIAKDMISSNPERSAANPYKLEIDSFQQVDPALIKYEEFRQIKLSLEAPAGIALSGNRLFLVGDQKLLHISTRGELIAEHNLDADPYCITTMADNLLCIGFRDHFKIYTEDATLVSESEKHSSSSFFTAIAVKDDMVYIADAGIRRVLVYDREGNFKSEIRGETGDGTSHGFIIPSPNFHLGIDPDGKLWVSNPGIHTLQQYSQDGTLENSWSKASSPDIDGFNGCCNPAIFTFLPDGRFLTSEKGLVRIKVYSPSGEFESVVAAPLKFTEDGHAPDLVVDEQGNVIALDIDKKMIRFFNPS